MSDTTTHLTNDNKTYWTGRVDGYSRVNQTELATSQHQRWMACLCDEIRRTFPARTPASIRVLDIGTGPGFFAILMAEAGFDITAIDLTPAMLAEAAENAGALADKIRFLEMNAEALGFEDGALSSPAISPGICPIRKKPMRNGRACSHRAACS